MKICKKILAVFCAFSVMTLTLTTITTAFVSGTSAAQPEAERENDYSSITFDTVNGTTQNISSGSASYYDGSNAPIGGNTTNMIRFNCGVKAGTTYLVPIYYGTKAVPLVSGKTYRMAFDYYGDTGVSLSNFVLKYNNNNGDKALVTSKSDKWGADSKNFKLTGTEEKWVRYVATFTASEDAATIKFGLNMKEVTENKYVYFDNFSFIEIEPEKENDYSSITFDTVNGTSGNLSSSVWSFYGDSVIAGNNTNMLRLNVGNVKGTLAANITYGQNSVPLVAGQQYRLEFDYYSDAGIDFDYATVRNQSNNIKIIGLSLGSEGTNGEWKHYTTFFKAPNGSQTLKFGITIKSVTADKYMYFDNFSLTEFSSESPITFDDNKNNTAVDSSTSVWRYSNEEIAGNATMKLTNGFAGMSTGTIYNDLGETIPVTSGITYGVRFDYYIAPYTGTLGAIYYTDYGFNCALDTTNDEGTGGIWKTAELTFDATSDSEAFKFRLNTSSDFNGKLYIDNLVIVELYDCDEEPEILYVTPNTIALDAKEGYEYSLDGIHFSDGVFTDLYKTGTRIFSVYCREKISTAGFVGKTSQPIFVQLPVYGDANGDNKLNAEDMVLLRRLLLDIDHYDNTEVFDVHIDGSIDILDLVALQKAIESGITPEDNLNILRNNNSYTLAWNDEFSDAEINRTKWVDRNSHETGSLQHYVNDKDNLYIDTIDGNACLIMKAIKENVTVGETTYNYSSAALDTYKQFSFKRGYVEIRAKLPKGEGLWPAFWFGGTSNREGSSVWPDNGEIDVFEYYGYSPKRVTHNFHWSENNTAGEKIHRSLSSVAGLNCTTEISEEFYKDFHTFGCEWTDAYVAFYVDGELELLYQKTEAQSSINEEDMYLILNLAVGGSSENQYNNIENTEFPAQMAVDYVRYYK